MYGSNELIYIAIIVYKKFSLFIVFYMNINFTNLFKNFKKAVVVSHDAGGAEVLSRIVKQTKIKKYFFLSGPAKKIFRRNKEEKFSNIYETINKADLCICSTSMDNDTYYAAFQYAKKRGVYTIVVLDHWNFYKDRIQSTKRSSSRSNYSF